MAKRKADVWDVTLDDQQKIDLADDLCRDLQDTIDARASVTGPGGKLDYLDWLYEQGRSQPKDLPFPGAADLNSYLITQSVDAMQARVVGSITSVSPLCTVDAWGNGASKAPFIEEFHDWQVGETGLLPMLNVYVLQGLMEEAGILEVRERIETKRTVEERTIAIQINEAGAALMGPDGKPLLMRDDAGELVDAEPGQPSAKIELTSTKTKRLGPEYDVISLRDFGYLPGHAKNHRQVYGYYKRFHERVVILKERVADGIYDAKAVEDLGDANNRSDATPPRTVDRIASQDGLGAEQELYELSIKRDLDKDGREEWYVVTLSLRTKAILRCKLDKFAAKVGRCRFVPFVPCPRRDSVYGYIYAEKLSTLAEEQAALRNSTADRNALAVSAPIKVLTGAAWNPSLEPFGVGRTIRVNAMNEIEQMVVADVPQSSIYLGRDIIQANERVSGLSDVGVIGSGDRQSNTLGQDQMVAGASNVRVNVFVDALAESVSAIMHLAHAIWIETLEEDTKGLEAPSNVTDALQQRGVELEGGRFTAEQLKARVRFNAYGTTETADPGKSIQYFTQGFLALTNMAKFVPAMQAMFMDPEVAMSLVDQALRVYKFPNRAPFAKAIRAGIQQQQMMASMPQPGGMQPGAPPMGPPQGGPGMPPGMPPAGAPGPSRVLPFQGGPVVN